MVSHSRRRAEDRATLLEAETAGMLSSITASLPQPSTAFVDSLGQRLREEAARLPGVASGRAATAPRTGPVVLVMRRGLPRLLGAAVASAVVVGTGLGVASHEALPGSSLYPVRSLVDNAQVQWSGSELRRGRVLLQQAEGRIGDVRRLLGVAAEADQQPGLIAATLTSATDLLVAGQRTLLREHDRTGDPEPLLDVQRSAVRLVPQLRAVRSQVGEHTGLAVDVLVTLVGQGQAAVLRRAQACAVSCPQLLRQLPLVPDLAVPAGLPSVLAAVRAAAASGATGGQVPGSPTSPGSAAPRSATATGQGLPRVTGTGPAAPKTTKTRTPKPKRTKAKATVPLPTVPPVPTTLPTTVPELPTTPILPSLPTTVVPTLPLPPDGLPAKKQKKAKRPGGLPGRALGR